MKVFLTVIIILIAVGSLSYYVSKKSCGGKYPNPEIGGCGIYSGSELNKMKCEKAGGLFFAGGFGADNCIFNPPQSK